MHTPVLFVAAAQSGGHIMPALVLAQEWKNKHPDGSIIFFSSTKALDAHILAQHTNIGRIVRLPIDFRGSHYLLKPLLTIAGGIVSFIIGMFFCIAHKPTLVIGTGGLINIPVSLAAWVCRRPCQQYELNYSLGKAINVLQPFLTNIALVFPKTQNQCTLAGISFRYKCLQATYPLRFTHLDTRHDTLQTLSKLSLDPTKKTLFLLGGSQGSAFLSKLVQDFFIATPEAKKYVQIIHQCPINQTQAVTAFYKHHAINAHVFSFSHDIAPLYTAADLIISRAGAGTLFEIAFFNKQALIIPLHGHAANHQDKNARAIAEKMPGLFTIQNQQELAKNSDVFLTTLREKMLPSTQAIFFDKTTQSPHTL